MAGKNPYLPVGLSLQEVVYVDNHVLKSETSGATHVGDRSPNAYVNNLGVLCMSKHLVF